MNKTVSESLEIEALMDKILIEFDIPGIVISIFNSEEVIWQKAMGIRRIGNSEKIVITDNFHIGSNTKAITATMIASLVEDEILSWGSRPGDIFKDFSDEIHPGFHNVSIWNLLNHTAGIQPFTDGMELEKIPKATLSPKMERYLFSQLILSRKPHFPPNEEVNYSNAGYSIAASMAETVTGIKWELLIKERVLDKLGIQAKFSWPCVQNSNQPWGHSYHIPQQQKWNEISQGELQSHSPDHEYVVHPLLAPAGDIQLSSSEFSRFCQLHLSGLQGVDNILKSESFKFMHTDIKTSALGWGIAKAKESLVSAHSGCAGTFYSSALLYPINNLGIVLMANAGHAKAAEGCMKLMQKLFDDYLK